MPARWILVISLLTGANSASGQAFVPARTASAASAGRDLTPAITADARGGLRVTKGSGTLPNEHGQVWREYDISPYTARVKDSDRPQQAIVDWILRETGTDVWFAEPLGILSANRDDAAGLSHARDAAERARCGRTVREHRGRALTRWAFAS